MERRKFLTGAAGLMGGIGVTNILKNNVSINLFVSDNIGVSEKKMKVISEQVADSVESLGLECEVDYEYINVIIPDSYDGSYIMKKWDARIGDSDAEANLLLFDKDIISTGMGEYSGNSSIVNTYGRIKSTETEDLEKKVMPVSYDSTVLFDILHEIGHNLGLGHDDGYAWVDEEDVFITLMLSSYYFKKSEDFVNNHGQKIQATFSKNYYFVNSYNEKLSESDLLVDIF